MTASSISPPPPAAPTTTAAPPHRFGRMLDEIKDDVTVAAADCEIARLMDLGTAMNSTPTFFDTAGNPIPDDSEIPAGYTYLGQFIAHEVAFDQRDLSPTAEVNVDELRQVRSPALDLDSLYQGGPAAPGDRMFEADRVRMKVGDTTPGILWGGVLPHDLPRAKPNDLKHRQALIGDPRNDENLATAQTHLAFIKFHNKAADWLDAEKKKQNPALTATFDEVRDLVVRHFQWIVLKDYLPKIVEESAITKVLSHVRANGGQPKFFKPNDEGKIYTPVEFSGAAFRLGHSMVRESYEWNRLRNSGRLAGRATLCDLFRQTALRGNLEGKDNLPGDWIVDWRHFYDFPDFDRPLNKAKMIDTSINLRLEACSGPPAVPGHPITTLNLLRGFTYRLPSGQAVAEVFEEEKLSPEDVARGPHEAVLKAHGYHEKTPLWYYILKEAEIGGGNKLGPVGSRIVAETLIGMILNSGFSILDPADETKDWRPVLRLESGSAVSHMTDMLTFAKTVNPIPGT